MMIAPERARERNADKKTREDIGQKVTSQGLLSAQGHNMEFDTRYLDLEFQAFDKNQTELAMCVPALLEEFGVISTLQVSTTDYGPPVRRLVLAVDMRRG